MPKQVVEIEIPEGYELVGYRVPGNEELILVKGEVVPGKHNFGEYPILKKTRVSLHDFYKRVISYHIKNPHIRYGQAAYNHLKAMRPELADKINGTNCDPFPCGGSGNPQFERFVEFIESNWDK
jgi:hypothetical protein